MFDPDDYELHEAQKHARRMAKERDEARVMADKLTAELAACAAALPGVYYMDPPDGGDVPVSEQLRRMAKDAERYRLDTALDKERLGLDGARPSTPVGWSDTDWIKHLQDQEPHPLAGLHINQGSMNAAADAYEAEYNAAQEARRAERDAEMRAEARMTPNVGVEPHSAAGKDLE